MAANDSGKTIAVLALVGILGAGAFMGNSWLNAQHADYNILLMILARSAARCRAMPKRNTSWASFMPMRANGKTPFFG